MFYCTWLKDILQKTGIKMCRDRIEMQVLEAFAIRFPMKIAITKGIVYGIVAIFRDPGSIMEYPLPCRGSCKSRDTCREFMIHVLKAVNSPPGFHHSPHGGMMEETYVRISEPQSSISKLWAEALDVLAFILQNREYWNYCRWTKFNSITYSIYIYLHRHSK